MHHVPPIPAPESSEGMWRILRGTLSCSAYYQSPKAQGWLMRVPNSRRLGLFIVEGGLGNKEIEVRYLML